MMLLFHGSILRVMTLVSGYNKHDLGDHGREIIFGVREIMKIFSFWSLRCILANEIIFNADYQVSWSHDDETVQFTIVAENDGPIGFGINSQPNMHHAEMVIMGITSCEPECEAFVTEVRGGDRNGKPTIVENSIWRKVSSEKLGEKGQRIIIERPIRPTNCENEELSSSSVRLLWSLFPGPIVAITNESLMKYHGAVRRGAKTTHIIDHKPGLKIFLGTAPWEIYFVYFLVSRATFFALPVAFIKHLKMPKKC